MVGDSMILGYGMVLGDGVMVGIVGAGIIGVGMQALVLLDGDGITGAGMLDGVGMPDGETIFGAHQVFMDITTIIVAWHTIQDDVALI